MKIIVTKNERLPLENANNNRIVDDKTMYLGDLLVFTYRVDNNN